MSEQTRINSIADLQEIKKKYDDRMDKYEYKVLVCSGAGCISSNCHAVRDALIRSLEDYKISGKVSVVETGCIGSCDLGPVMMVAPAGKKASGGKEKDERVLYTKLTPADVPSIVASHLASGKYKNRKYIL